MVPRRVARAAAARPARPGRGPAAAGARRRREPADLDQQLPVVRPDDRPRPRRARHLVLDRTRHDALGHRRVPERQRSGTPIPETLPQHNIGDDFQVTFDQPGVYSFQCKIHSLVRGTVTVSNTPGDPDTEPDPVPKSNVDLTKPRDARRPPRRRSSAAAARPLQYSISERGKLDVEYYRYTGKGKRSSPATRPTRPTSATTAPGSAAESRISSRKPGPLPDRAAGHRRVQQHVEGPEAPVPDLVAGARGRPPKVIYSAHRAPLGSGHAEHWSTGIGDRRDHRADHLRPQAPTRARQVARRRNARVQVVDQRRERRR